jgi:hypothetical protein
LLGTGSLFAGSVFLYLPSYIQALSSVFRIGSLLYVTALCFTRYDFHAKDDTEHEGKKKIGFCLKASEARYHVSEISLWLGRRSVAFFFFFFFVFFCSPSIIGKR